MIPETLFISVFLFSLLMLVLYLRARSKLRDSLSKKQSLSVKYGRMTEQFMPFLKQYPYDEKNFRFIGSPIDGIQFEKDRIILMEFKTGNSRLSATQSRIKELVKKGRVYFEEFVIK